MKNIKKDESVQLHLALAYVILGGIIFCGVPLYTGQPSKEHISNVLSSFTEESFAESFGYGSCYNIVFGDDMGEGSLCPETIVEESICLVPGTSQNVNLSAAIDSGDNVNSMGISSGIPSGLSVTPTVAPGLPVLGSHTQTFTVAAQSGASGGMNELVFTTTFDGDGIFGKDARLNVLVDEDNSIASLDSLTPMTQNYQLSESATSTTIPVEVSFSDEENDFVNVVFELSSNNFSSILQSVTYTSMNTSITESLSHIFSSVPAGQYRWRSRLIEVGVAPLCEGYTNQSSASVEEQILTSGTLEVRSFVASNPDQEPTQEPTESVPIYTARVIGRVFNDINQNGTQDPGEQGLANITVRAFFTAVSAANNGMTGEYTLLTETNQNGDFSFDVPPGRVRIVIDSDDPDIPEGAIVSAGALDQEFEVVEGDNFIKTGFFTPTQELLEETGISVIILSVISVVTMIGSFLLFKKK